MKILVTDMRVVFYCLTAAFGGVALLALPVSILIGICSWAMLGLGIKWAIWVGFKVLIGMAFCSIPSYLSYKAGKMFSSLNL